MGRFHVWFSRNYELSVMRCDFRSNTQPRLIRERERELHIDEMDVKAEYVVMTVSVERMTR